jgi:hypothetical protein
VLCHLSRAESLFEHRANSGLDGQRNSIVYLEHGS